MGESLELLLVEDSEFDALLLVHDLRRAGFDVYLERVQSEDEMRTALLRHRWDVVISDYQLPAFDAPAALQVLRQTGQDIPFIVVSGTIGEETAVQIMRAGAHDYLMKGNLNRLAEALRREMREAQVRRERQQAEVALRQSEDRYRLLFERAGDAIFVVDKKDGRYLDANHAAEILVGQSSEQISKLSIFDVTPANALQRLQSISGLSGAAEIGEVVYPRPDGSVRIAQLSVVPIDDDTVFGIAHDITERKQAEDELRSTRAFLDHTLKAIPLGISIYNVKSKQLEFDNDQNVVLRGSYYEQFNTMTDEERRSWVHPDDRERHRQFVMQLVTLTEGETRNIEYRHRMPNGSWRWLHLRYSIFERESTGHISKLLLIAEDVTVRKQNEQALERQFDELKILHRVATLCVQAVSVDALIQAITHAVGEALYSDSFGISLVDETGQFLCPQPSYRGRSETFPLQIPIDDCLAGQVYLTGKPMRVGDVTLAGKYYPVAKDICSELCVPIEIFERVIGVVNAESKQKDFFTAEDERLLLTIAGQLATAIERIRLFAAETQRRQEAETLREAISALSSSLELDQVLEVILKSLERVVTFDSATIFLKDGDCLRIVTARGVTDLPALRAQTYPSDDVLFRETIAKGQVVILDDAQADSRFMGWGNTTYVHGWMGVPLIAHGQVIGYITLDNRKIAAYSQKDAPMAQAFASQAAAAIQNAQLFQQVQKSLVELNQAYNSTIEGWSHAMDLRDRETEGHTLRVTETTIKLARALGLSEEDLVHIRRGALLHDMGKMGVPDRILLKPDKLTEEEWNIMRMHPQYAYDMLSPIDYLRPALDIPFAHHERWDGSGYPRGLKAEEIPLAARIFAVVDVWDALTSDRPYRLAWSYQVTCDYIKKHAGIYFDPEIVKEFSKLICKDKI